MHRKLLLFFLLPVVAGLLSSASASVPSGKNALMTVAESPAPFEYLPRVYACAFDGYVNIRKTPSMKGEVIGILRNGPGGAILLGEENGWSKINLRGTVGYVATKYLRDEPTVAVDERIDMSWLEGLWQYGTGNSTTDKYPYILYSGLLLFSDGTFLEYSDMFNEGGFTGSGTFVLEGCTLVLTKTMDYVNDRKTEETERILLYPERHGMQDHYKKRFATQQEFDAFDPEEWSGSGVLLTTRQAFRKMGRK